MRFALAIALVAGVAGAVVIRERPAREDSRVREGDDESGPPALLLSFASVDGGGMGTACACQDVYAYANGASQLVTTTRTGDAMCSKRGLALAGYSPGDMVTCGTDKPRVEPDDAGVLGLRKEYAPENKLLYSQQFQQTAWSFSTAMTTADSQTAPDNTATGDTLTDSNAGVRQHARQFISSTTNGLWTVSVFVKGGTLTAAGLQVQTGGGSGNATCEYTGLSTTTWTRMVCSVTTSGAHTTINFYLLLGANAAATGTIYAWGAQINQGALTSHIPTGASAVALGFEATSVPYPSGFSGTGCASLKFSPGFTGAITGNGGAYLASDGSDRWLFRDIGVLQGVSAFNGTTQLNSSGSAPYVYDTPVTIKGVYGASTATLTAGAASGTGSYTMGTPGANLFLGGQVSAGNSEGILNRFVIDTSSTGCD